MKQVSEMATIQLGIPLDKADGELLYCIRQANPEQRFWGRSEPSRNSIRYALAQQDANLIGAGDAGSILLWSAGDQTCMGRPPPPQPTEREALAYILTRLFRAQSCWPDRRSQPPDAAVQLVEGILSHVAANQKTEIVFGREVPVSVLEEFCKTIRVVLASALDQSSAGYISRPPGFKGIKIVSQGFGTCPATNPQANCLTTHLNPTRLHLI